MNLNLGCNDLPLEGFINIDIDPSVNPDVVADSMELPYPDNSVDEIYAGHLLEHVTSPDKALKEWYRVLRPGGRITITVPDTQKALEMFNNGGISYDLLTQVVYGATDRDQQNHAHVYTETILLDQMKPYFTATIVDDSPYAVIKVEWQTIAEGVK